MPQFAGRHSSTRYSLEAELDLLSPRMRQALFAAVAEYQRTGIRFALCGGLASGSYGEPRATRDIDFLVGDEAFHSKGLIVSFAHPLPLQAGGYAVDAIPMPDDPHRAAVLNEELSQALIDSSTGVSIPVLSPTGLAYMKLISARPKDVNDILAMVESGAVDLKILDDMIEGDEELQMKMVRVRHELGTMR